MLNLLIKNKTYSLIAFVLIASLTRIIPHPWNFTAVGAIAFFSGARFEDKKMALWVPVLTLFITDLILGFHSTVLFTYGGFLLMSLLGRMAQRTQFVKTTGLLITSSLAFYFVSNFGVWAVENYYPKTFEGLIQCYVMGIPFLQRQLMADLFYSGLLFAAYEALNRKVWMQVQKV